MADANRTVVSHAVHRGREYVSYSDGSQWSRKVDRKTGKALSEWSAIEAPVAQEEPSTLYLSVVVQYQAENEPKHWSLFSHRPDSAGTGRGQVWQVKGDAELMRHQHASNTDILNSASFAWHQVLNASLSDSQFARVDRVARAEPAPRAVNRAAVTENCQGWVIRVLWRLVSEGIVEESTVTMLQGYMDPIN
ncbi:hypothetical protein HRG_012319 [Hirsutella rhossiliensis]